MADYRNRTVTEGSCLFGSAAGRAAFLERSEYLAHTKRVRISVEGYPTWLPEDDINKALMNLFNSCGDIAGIKIRRDPETRAVYRRAFIVLLGNDAEEKALHLNGIDVGGWTALVKVAPEEDEETERYRTSLANQVYNDPKCMFGVGVRGYDTSLPANYVKSALTNHFSSCGEITHVFVNTADNEVHIYFSEENAETRALALYGSVVQGRELVTRRLVTARGILAAAHYGHPPTDGYAYG